jgi:putative effector of murein hydrolase
MKKINHSIPPVLVAVGATVLILLVHIFVRSRFAPGAPLRLLLTSALVVCFAWVIWEQVRVMRSLDEFQKHVHFLALAIAFPVGLVALFALGYFRAEGLLEGADSRDLPIILILAYAGGLLIAWRHYRISERDEESS